MRLLICVLLALAAGFFTYLGSAVVWCTIDPQRAAPTLLFTIPTAIAGMAAPALLGVLGVVAGPGFPRRFP
jgi:hypothetical protein